MKRSRDGKISRTAEYHLGIDHLQHDLIARSVRGGLVTLVMQGIKVVLQIAAIVVLARLLAPEDFGQFAMVAALLTLLELFKDLGLSTATVQRRDVTPGHLNTLFWLNAGLGLAVTLLMVALAPLLAWFFDERVLLDVTPAVAIAFLFTGLSTQHLALLRRQMRFTTSAVLQVVAEFMGFIAAIAAAMAGLGIWALVIRRLAWAAATTAGAWFACGWRPGRPGRLADVRAFISFGGNTTAAMVVGQLTGALDKILIGWYWGAAPLGLFERSRRLVLLPIQNLNVPIGNVAFPALSRLVDQPKRYRATYLAAVERLAMVIAPLGGLLVAAAGPIIDLALGAQWSEAAPILSWMGLAAFYMPVTYALSWLYMSQDRTREMLRASLVGACLTIVAILCGLPFGAVGVAAAMGASGLLLRAPVLFWFAGRDGPVRTRDFYLVLITPVSAGLAVAAAVWALRRGTALDLLSSVMEVAVLALLAMAVSLSVYAALPRGREALRGIVALPGMLRGKKLDRANA